MADSLIGRRLAHYDIVEELGRGGMGVVYRAIDTNLGREIALKVLPDDLVHDKTRRDRLLHEARAASLIEHPHIAVIHDVGEADGVTFIAMELIRGEKLSDILSRGPLPPKRAIELGLEIAEGLSRAHEKGLIHRDLKPANVMITDDGHAKVIDFGLAKVFEPVDQGAATVSATNPRTDSGTILGTAAYMSPEQARGLRIDPRSDVFSFGVVLYEMLTGRAPFQGATSLDTMHAILTQPMPPLPAIGDLPTERAADIRRVIDKATAKDADDRYQGIKDIVVDLRTARRLLESVSASAALPSPVAGARPHPMRFPAAAVIAGVVALVAAVAIFWWFSRPAEPAAPPRSGKPALAVLYFDNHTGEASLDWMRTGLADMMVTDLSQSRDIEVLGTDRLYQILAELRRADDRTLAPEVIQQVAQRAGVDTLLVGSYIKAGDAIRINARLQEVTTGRVLTSERVEGVGEASLFSLVDELTRRIKAQVSALRAAAPPSLVMKPGAGSGTSGPALDRDLADVTTSSIEAYRAYVEGMSFHERGLYAQAMAPFKRAVEIDPQFAMAFAKLAVVHNNLGLSRQRDEYARRALDQIDRLPTRERYYIEGLYYTPRPETRERGIEAYRQGLALHPEHHAMRHNLGLTYFMTERFRDAIPHYEELIGRGTTTASTHGQLGMSYVSLGEVQRGREVLEAYLRRYPESGQGLRYYAEALLAEGRLDDARAAFERSATLNPGAFQTRVGLWVVAVLQARSADAEAVVKQLAASKSPIERHLSVVLAAEYAVYFGRGAEALAVLDRGARDPDVDPEDRARVLTQLALHQLRQKRAAAALVHAQQAMREARNTNEELQAVTVLAVVQADAGRLADADRSLAQLEAHAKLWPGPRGQRAVHWVRGNLARARGDRATAAAELAKAESLLPVNSSLLSPPLLQATVSFDAATATAEAGRDDGALKFFERFQAAYEHTFDLGAYARSLYLLAGIYERRGDTARARALYARFLDLWRDGDLERGWVAEAIKTTSR